MENAFDEVNKPEYYAGSKIEVIDYIEDKQLGFCLGNVIKYVSRAGKKHSAGMEDKEKEIQDLEKAKWYLERRIKEIKEGIVHLRCVLQRGSLYWTRKYWRTT